jgi:tetratricopeptide (TPR) repeat protein
MPKSLEASYHFPGLLPSHYSYYYDQMSAAQLSYREYLLKISMVKDIEDTIEGSTDRQIAANEFFTKMLNSSIVDAQIASTKALYNNMRDINGTLITGFTGVSKEVKKGFTGVSRQLDAVTGRLDVVSERVDAGFDTVSRHMGVGFSVLSGQLHSGFSNVARQMESGFSGVSRQIGSMQAAMCMAFAHLDSTVQKSVEAICDKLDAIHDILNNPRLHKSRELYRMASSNYNNGFFKEALEDLKKAVQYHRTDYRSWFLIGKIYLFGLNGDYDVIDLDAAIEAFEKAVQYIRPDAENHNEARVTAAYFCYYLGLAQQTKAMDSLHAQAEFKSYLKKARDFYMKSWHYSPEMLESRYNRARCNVLLGDIENAMQDLETIIVKDPSYCIKSALDSDFYCVRESLQELFRNIKTMVYSDVKACFDRIRKIKAEFQGSYSPKLTQLMKTYLPYSFTENIPPVDVLEGWIFFPKIIESLEREKAIERERIEKEKAIEIAIREKEIAMERERLEQKRKERESLEKAKKEILEQQRENQKRARLEQERLEKYREEEADRKNRTISIVVSVIIIFVLLFINFPIFRWIAIAIIVIFFLIISNS